MVGRFLNLFLCVCVLLWVQHTYNTCSQKRASDSLNLKLQMNIHPSYKPNLVILEEEQALLDAEPFPALSSHFLK